MQLMNLKTNILAKNFIYSDIENIATSIKKNLE